MLLVEALALELGDDLPVGEHRDGLVTNGRVIRPAQVLEVVLDVDQLVDPLRVVGVVGGDVQDPAGLQP